MQKSSVAGLWKYMVARENIRLARAKGLPWPWTKDKILQQYKFTNVQREQDKTSKVFAEVYETFRRSYTPGLLLYNCGVARYFGTFEFYVSLGWQSDFDPQRIIAKVRERRAAGKPVFTRAYVITNGGLSMPKEEYVMKHPLKALWYAANDITAAITVKQSWEAGYKLLHQLDGFGGTGFMAKEVLMDYIRYEVTLRDRDTFTPVGPGALRGLGRILKQDPYYKAKRPLEEIRALWGTLRSPWEMMHPLARPLTCSDIQFCLCEYDKYERTRLGEGKPKNKYVRSDK